VWQFGFDFVYYGRGVGSGIADMVSVGLPSRHQLPAKAALILSSSETT
jgi:hypothetical protein